MPVNRTPWILLGVTLAVALLGSCREVPGPEVDRASLENRAYVVARDSDELTVIDLDRLEVIGQVATAGISNHMASLNGDFTKVYINSSGTNETIVVDARTLKVARRIAVGEHPGHLTLDPDTGLMAVMNEDSGTVTFIDTRSDTIVKELPGFAVPHFMRFRDGYGYVANLGANHVTKVDMRTLEIVDRIYLPGFADDRPPAGLTTAPWTHHHPDGSRHVHGGGLEPEASDATEFGFPDAQIDADGVLYAPHMGTGRILVYDTRTGERSVIEVDRAPWAVFAEHPFRGVAPRYLVNAMTTARLFLIDGSARRLLPGGLPGDEASYGVNYSPLTPNLAFVMNRTRRDVAVVDLEAGAIVDRIPVGGHTETASTTADGRYILATVSGADKVVVIDPTTRSIVKEIEGVGSYPWSVYVPRGQNYCH